MVQKVNSEAGNRNYNGQNEEDYNSVDAPNFRKKAQGLRSFVDTGP